MKLLTTILVLFVITTLYSCTESKVSDVNTQEHSDTITSNDREVFNHEYAHVVYFWFKDPNNKADRVLFETSLRTFLNASEYAKTEFIGTPPVATRAVVNDTFTYNLILSFESAAAQQKYQEESAHQVFIDECAHLWENVVVYDASAIKN